MKRILVLGASGFSGTHVSLALASLRGVRLILGCRDGSRLHEGLRDEERREGDLRDPLYLDTLFKDVDTVIHLASWASLFSEKENSRRLFLEPSLALISKAKEEGVKKFINMSTLSAASSDVAADANSAGMIRPIWPHLNNIVRIEDALREAADKDFQVINLRCGLFIGKHYSLGLLPILLPRLKTHLVPLVQGGSTQMPLISGEDISQAFVKAALSEKKFGDYEAFNIMGKEVPKVKDVLGHLHQRHAYPYPHFSVPFFIAYPFARLMELLNPFLPFEPLIVRSIVHLLENTNTNNEKAEALLDYLPRSDWKAVIDEQVEEMHRVQSAPMSMKRRIV